MSDIDPNFDAHPVTGDIGLLTERDSIIQSVKNLVRTAFYERKFWPNIGNQIANSLFENYSRSLTEFSISKSLSNVIMFQEPRAREVEIRVNINSSGQAIDAIITFLPVNSTTRVEITEPLLRIR